MVGIPVPIDTSSLNRRISALESAIKAMAGARSLSAATISDGGLTIRDGGDVTIRDGGELHVDGLSTFGGDMRVTGTLSLPAGIINNEALASPSNFARTGGGAGGFSTGPTSQAVAIQQIAVPDGYSRAIVMAVGTAAAQNTTTAANFLYVGARIGSVAPNLTWALAGPSGYANATASATRTITGLSGGTIECAVMVSTGAGTWTGPSMANLDAIAIFLR